MPVDPDAMPHEDGAGAPSSFAASAPDEPPGAVHAHALLRLFYATVPGAEGVIVATPDGTPLVHDLPPAFDVAAVVARTDAHRRAPTDREPASAFVDTVYGRTLVVFVEPGFAVHAGLVPPMDAPSAEWGDEDGTGDAPQA